MLNIEASKTSKGMQIVCLLNKKNLNKRHFFIFLLFFNEDHLKNKDSSSSSSSIFSQNLKRFYIVHKLSEF